MIISNSRIDSRIYIMNNPQKILKVILKKDLPSLVFLGWMLRVIILEQQIHQTGELQRSHHLFPLW